MRYGSASSLDKENIISPTPILHRPWLMLSIVEGGDQQPLLATPLLSSHASLVSFLSSRPVPVVLFHDPINLTAIFRDKVKRQRTLVWSGEPNELDAMLYWLHDDDIRCSFPPYLSDFVEQNPYLCFLPVSEGIVSLLLDAPRPRPTRQCPKPGEISYVLSNAGAAISHKEIVRPRVFQNLLVCTRVSAKLPYFRPLSFFGRTHPGGCFTAQVKWHILTSGHDFCCGRNRS